MPSSSEDESDTLFQSHYNPRASSPSSSSSPSPSPSPPPSHQPPNFFAPPFYNRPPTPLPPSPSLTSLLRPSRPTTPDSSDNDLDPTRARHPVPRASPIVPTYEYYGFVLYLFSSLAFLMYILWSYLPSPFLHALGVHYYPNRWWSLAIPSWLVMGLVYVYVALASYNTGHLTLGLGSIETVVDDAANVATIDGKGRLRPSRGSGIAPGRKDKGRREREREGMPADKREWRALWSQGTDAVMDVPLGGVCEVLYGEGRERNVDDEELEGR